MEFIKLEKFQGYKQNIAAIQKRLKNEEFPKTKKKYLRIVEFALFLKIKKISKFKYFLQIENLPKIDIFPKSL